MAHKTLIGGTAYEISGGKTLVNGTAYSIDKGKTLVGGTAYEVGFATDPVITIKQSSELRASDSSHARVTINEVVYDGSQEVTLILPIGTVITCYVSEFGMPQIVLYDKDGNELYNNRMAGNITYDYVAKTNATIEIGSKNTAYIGQRSKILIYEQ